LAAVAVVIGIRAGLAEAASLPDVVAEVRRHTAGYLDVARARSDGFVQAGGMRALHGIHFVNPRAAAGGHPRSRPGAAPDAAYSEI